MFCSMFTVFRLISAETGPTSATKEHLGLAGALNIPVFIIITKWDLVEKEQLDRFVSAPTPQICTEIFVF